MCASGPKLMRFRIKDKTVAEKPYHRLAVQRPGSEPTASSGPLDANPRAKETGLESAVASPKLRELRKRAPAARDYPLTCFGTSEFDAVGCEARLRVEWILLCFLREITQDSSS